MGESGLVIKPDEPHILFYGTFGAIVRIVYPKDQAGEVQWDEAPEISINQDVGRNTRALSFDPSDPDMLYAAMGNYDGFKIVKVHDVNDITYKIGDPEETRFKPFPHNVYPGIPGQFRV